MGMCITKVAFLWFGGSDFAREYGSLCAVRQKVTGQIPDEEIWIVSSELPEAPLFNADSILHFEYCFDTVFEIMPVVPVLAKYIIDREIDLVVLPEDDRAAVIAPMLASATGAACLRACSDIRFENREPIVTKQVYGGNLSAVFALTGSPAILTWQSGNGICTPEDVHNGEIVSVQPEPVCDDRIEVLETTTPAGESLEDAKILFAVGRAFHSKAETEPVFNTARALNAEVGATRPLVQDGLLPPERLIGITGASVSPKLLVAVGLSGSAPFMQGAQGAEKIYAFNEDSNAPVFRAADVGMVVDCKKVIGELNSRLGGE